MLSWLLGTLCTGPRNQPDKEQHGDFPYCSGPFAFAKQLGVSKSTAPHAGAAPLRIADYKCVYYMQFSPMRRLRHLKARFDDLVGNSDGILGHLQSVEEGVRLCEVLVPKLTDILDDTSAYKAKQLSWKLMAARFQRFAVPAEWSNSCIRDLEALALEQKGGFSFFPNKALSLSAVAEAFDVSPLEFSLAYCQWSSLPIDAAWVYSHQALLMSTASAFFEQHGFAMLLASLVREETSQLDLEPGQSGERPAKQQKKSNAPSGEVALRSKMPDLTAEPDGAHALQWEGSDGKVLSGRSATCVLCKRMSASGTNAVRTFGDVCLGTCFVVRKHVRCLGQAESAEHYRRRCLSQQGSKTWMQYFANIRCGSTFCGPTGSIHTEVIIDPSRLGANADAESENE